MLPLPLYQSLDEVRSEALKCRACGRAESRHLVVFGSGAPSAPLMLIGEGPSEADDIGGDPFTGPAGRYLDELLADAGIDRSQIWLTNVVKCRAWVMRHGRRQNRAPRATELRACASWLSLEFEWVNPKVILTIGAPAAHAVITPELRLMEQRGEWHQLPGGRLAMATLQPAYLMRLRETDEAASRRLAGDVRDDIQAAAIRAGLLEI
ncbi:MAG TPA: uracil-DNA glycosylase [Thermomicrobiaceae bacterium]|nr:uracil-DNA glycosylase [Thermomicrobiaceae bacterium]